MNNIKKIRYACLLRMMDTILPFCQNLFHILQGYPIIGLMRTIRALIKFITLPPFLKLYHKAPTLVLKNRSFDISVLHNVQITYIQLKIICKITGISNCCHIDQSNYVACENWSPFTPSVIAP